jgi:uncharacterized iron-regulated membrane protein
MTATLNDHDTPPPLHRSVPVKRKPWFGALLLRLHFYAGILVGPFILIAAVSEAMYAATPQLEQAIYAEELHVPTSQTSVPLADQIEAAQAVVRNEGSLVAVRPAPYNGDTTRVMFTEEGLGEGETRAIFITPPTPRCAATTPRTAPAAPFPCAPGSTSSTATSI